MTKISIHQPNFIPWLGYFYKIYKSDAFVFLDDAEFSKQSYMTRVILKNVDEKAHQLNLPIQKNQNHKPINKVLISGEFNRNKTLKTIKQLYSKAEFFNEYFDFISGLVMDNNNNLSIYNSRMVVSIAEKIGLKTNFHFSSDAAVDGVSQARIINLCKRFEASEYISGMGAKNYQDCESFQNEGIKLSYCEFQGPEYRQIWGDYLPNCSVLDYLFNCGSPLPYFHQISKNREIE